AHLLSCVFAVLPGTYKLFCLADVGGSYSANGSIVAGARVTPAWESFFCVPISPLEGRAIKN
ncbi:MAG: hypothetical protein PF447_09365, partial [Spirochaetaceae bacterium]|nr:hypothetical protein [Spirochaetaceae bacterium]